jgi:enoyl-CoA hydratase/carnithine racemase
VKEAKRLMYASFGRGAAEHISDTSSTLRQLFQTADHREGIASFLERRPAEFKGA